MTSRRRRKKIDGISVDQMDKVMKSKKVTAAVEAKAVKVQTFWKSIAPVFGDRPARRATPAWGQPGSYQNSIVIRKNATSHGPRVRVTALDWKARMIEFGNAHMPEYAPMAKVKAKFRR